MCYLANEGTGRKICQGPHSPTHIFERMVVLTPRIGISVHLEELWIEVEALVAGNVSAERHAVCRNAHRHSKKYLCAEVITASLH